MDRVPSLFFIRISPSANRGPCSANCCVKRLRSEQSRTTKYAPASRCAPNFAKAAHQSGFHFALARPLLFPTKCPRYAVVLCGDPICAGALSLHFIQMATFSPYGRLSESSEPPQNRLAILWGRSAQNFVSASVVDAYARLCTLPRRGARRTLQYAPASRCAPNIAKAAHMSGFHFALARPLLFPTKCPHFVAVLCGDPVIPHKVSSLRCGTLRGPHMRRGAFAFCIQMGGVFAIRAFENGK